MNKKKLCVYVITMNYHYVEYGFRTFIVWAYTKDNAIILVANKLGLSTSQISLMGDIYISKYLIYSFFVRLFNKAPKEPICTEV